MKSELAVAKREKTGKGPSKLVRKKGRVPGVLYGAKTEALPVSVDPKDLKKALSSPMGRNTLLVLKGAPELEGKMALVREEQRDVITRDYIHVDLLEVALDQALEVEIPVILTGRSKGVVEGGVMQQARREIVIRCLPEAIPEKIEVDVTDLEIGQSIHISDLQLPEGASAVDEERFTVCAVLSPRAEEEVAAEEVEEGEEAGEAAEGAEKAEKKEKEGE